MGRPTLWAVLGVVTAMYAAEQGVHPTVGVPVFVVFLGLVQVADEQRRATSERIREALRLCGLAQKEAAYLIGVDPADFQKMLDGQRKLDLWRLEMLPESFQQTYAMLTLRDRGLPEYARTALKIVADVVNLPRKVSA